MNELKKIQKSLSQLRISGYENLYSAGLPNYNRNFSRDSFIYGLIANDYEALEAQIAFSALHQGTKSNPQTGEENGKIHHEFPGVEMDGLNTCYNACDTTALFLFSIASLNSHIADSSLTEKYRATINLAISYIQSHIKDNLFWEDPSLSGAQSFALNVTYWKDSVLNGLDSKPRYPIIYSLAHFQNASALVEIGKVLNDSDLEKQGIAMMHAGFRELWNNDHFITAIEGNGDIIDPLSTDSLYSLFFISKNLLPRTYASKIQQYSKPLETRAGYRSGIPDSNNTNTDQYHTRFVWVYEQAIINIAAHGHHLRKASKISTRIVPYLKKNFAEELDTNNDFHTAGDSVQLWSISAATYFLGN